MTNYREILRLESLGINHSQIAASVGCTRQTVISVLRKARQKDITYPTAREMSDTEIVSAIQHESATTKIPYRMPDYAKVHKELMRSGVTLSLLWVEYCEECRLAGEIPYQSTQFNKYYADYARQVDARMHIERKPAESLEVDWCGSTVPIVNADNGEVEDAYVFVGALSFSGYAYVEAFWSMVSAHWIQAHVNAFEYFGGVTRWVTPDNLKTGIVRNTRQETIVNKTYQEMAEYYGTAIIPARVERPNDKPTAEGVVKVVQIWILAAIRNMKFFTLTQLNETIREKLKEFNTRKFQKKDGSRFLLFMEEKPLLLPLPKYAFEIAEWKQATVQKDYHVKCGRQYYSVPYTYIGKKVDLRVTSRMVEILFAGERIASHAREERYAGKYITQEAHMPINHQQYGSWSGDRFRRWAEKIGPACSRVVEYFLATAKLEQQAYKTCNALLHLADHHTGGRLEAACERILQLAPRPSYKAIETILRSQKNMANATTSQELVEEPVPGFIRGAGYYAGGDTHAQ